MRSASLRYGDVRWGLFLSSVLGKGSIKRASFGNGDNLEKFHGYSMHHTHQGEEKIK